MGTTIRPPHPLGSDFGLMWGRDVHVDDPALDVIIDLEVDIEDGRLVVDRLTAERREGGPPITIGVLKSLPLVGLTARAAEGGLLSGLVRRFNDKRGRGWSAAQPEELDKLPEAERAAVVYRAALFFGLAPTAAVAEVLGVTRDMAAKRVQAARLAGLLEPTTKGRKGA